VNSAHVVSRVRTRCAALALSAAILGGAAAAAPAAAASMPLLGAANGRVFGSTRLCLVVCTTMTFSSSIRTLGDAADIGAGTGALAAAAKAEGGIAALSAGIGALTTIGTGIVDGAIHVSFSSITW
jgi:hypothetical protein